MASTAPVDRTILRFSLTLAKQQLTDHAQVHKDIRATVGSELLKQLQHPLTRAQVATLAQWTIATYEMGIHTGMVLGYQMRTGRYPKPTSRRRPTGGAR